MDKGKDKMEKGITSFRIKAICFLAAALFITICSKSSFIYPLNDWGDANCYYIIGKGLTHGMIPYRDLYDQKGVIIFFIYAIASMISERSFLGVYFIEIFSATFFLYYTYKIVSIFKKIDSSFAGFVFLIASVSFSSASFCHGGSAEEILLPVFTYGLYLCARQLEKKVLASKLEMLIFGMLSALLFYTKFTLCSFLMALIAFMIIGAKKDKVLDQLMKNALYYILGTAVISIPVFAYFIVNDSLYYFYEGYFYKNIFEEIGEDTIFRTGDINLIINSLSNYFRKRNILAILFNVTGLYWLHKEKKKLLFWCHIISFAVLFYIQFLVVAPQKYYGLPLSALGAFGICFILDILEKRKAISNGILSAVVIVVSILIAFIFTDNKYFMFKNKSETPQVIFANEMEQYGKEDYNLLYYGALDEGYYLACNKIPNCRAFIQTNLPGNYLGDLQYEHVKEKNVDFIVTKKVLCDEKDYKKMVSEYGEDFQEGIITFNDFGYSLIDEVTNVYESNVYVTRLYKIND